VHVRVCLDSLTWREGLVRLSASLGCGIDLENALRIAHHLQNLAPPPYSRWALCALDDAGFEGLLGNGTFDLAAAALIGPALQHEARAGEGPAQARVWLDDRGPSCAADGPSAALALVAAWTGFALARLDESPSLSGQAGASSHKSA
jgi:hypothetical protein